MNHRWRSGGRTAKTVLYLVIAAAPGLSCGEDSSFESAAHTRPDGGVDTGASQHTDLVSSPTEDNWRPGGWVVGHSVLDRPIVAEQYGVAGPILFLFSGIHGDERTAVTSAERTRTLLQGGLAESAGARVVFVSAANPDGIAAETRENANGLDLNRNFDTSNFDINGDGGTTPLSEPETQALAAIIDWVYPGAVVSLHCCVPTLDYDGPGEALAEAMAAAMDPSIRFPIERFGSMPGSAGCYAGGDLGLPLVTVEFAKHGALDVFDQLDGVASALEAAVIWVANNRPDQTTGSVADLETSDATLDTRILGDSAGGLAVRAEILLQGEGPPVLLLAGLDDNEPRALHVAEHVRRAMISDVRDVPLILWTAPNPDGIASGSRFNAAGVDVSLDFAGDAPSSPEAQYLTDLVDTFAPRLVIGFAHDPEEDSVSYWGLDSSFLETSQPSALVDLGTPTTPAGRAFIERGIPVVVFGIHNEWGRGDNDAFDAFPQTDPALFSALARRVVTPGLLCAEDGFCDTLCQLDPDCRCGCDFNTVCEAAWQGTDETCACDPDCAGGLTACESDTHCDTWCPVNTDPDCECSCDYNEFCEAAMPDSTETCACDPNCEGGLSACGADGHCDSWCAEGADPDCP